MRNAPGSEEVNLYRAMNADKIGGRGALVGIVIDPCVVHEHVQLAERLSGGLERRPDRDIIRDVDLDNDRVTAAFPDLVPDGMSCNGVPRSENDGQTTLSDLTRNLGTDPTVRTGDKGNPVIRALIRHSISTPRSGTVAS